MKTFKRRNLLKECLSRLSITALTNPCIGKKNVLFPLYIFFNDTLVYVFVRERSSFGMVKYFCGNKCCENIPMEVCSWSAGCETG